MRQWWWLWLAAAAVVWLGATTWLSRLPSSRADLDREAIDHDVAAGAPQRTQPSAASRRTVVPDGAGRGWPTLLGPSLDGTSPETGLELNWPKSGPIEKWHVAVGTGYASPVTLGDALVLLHRKDDREVLECFDPESGASRWTFSWPATYRCPYSHSSGPYAAPVLEDGYAYAIGASGDLYCVRLDDGTEVWHRSLHQDYRVTIEVWPVAASPLIVGDRLIVNIGGRKTNAGIVALDKRTGETLWTATSDGASCSTPRAATIHGKRYVFVWTADALVSLDPEDGRVFWRIPFCANNQEAAHGTTPLVAGDVVFVSGYQLGNLSVRVLPDGSYQELWRDKRQLLDSQYNPLLYVDGMVWGFSATRRRLRCLDLATGDLRWEWRSSKFPLASTIAVDGRYLVFSERGYLAVLALTDDGITVQAITRRPVLAPPCLSYPALHRGLLYLRNEEEMVSIDLRRAAAEGPAPRR